MALSLNLAAEELRALLESAYLLTERREYDKAKEVFEAVEALGQGVDVAQVGLANLHLVQGMPKEAEKYLKAATETNPKSAYAHAQLAELLHTQGKGEEAKAAADQAIELDPDGPAGDLGRSIKDAVDLKLAYDYGASARGKK